MAFAVLLQSTSCLDILRSFLRTGRVELGQVLSNQLLRKDLTDRKTRLGSVDRRLFFALTLQYYDLVLETTSRKRLSVRSRFGSSSPHISRPNTIKTMQFYVLVGSLPSRKT
jgi:hypothetical protein